MPLAGVDASHRAVRKPLRQMLPEERTHATPCTMRPEKNCAGRSPSAFTSGSRARSHHRSLAGRAARVIGELRRVCVRRGAVMSAQDGAGSARGFRVLFLRSYRTWVHHQAKRSPPGHARPELLLDPRAEELFREYLARVYAGEPVDFDAMDSTDALVRSVESAGKTSSTGCAAASDMRRAPYSREKLWPLHGHATRSPRTRPERCTRAKPNARRPHCSSR